MKKLLAGIMACLVLSAAVVGSACSNRGGELFVVAPDGAPALALVNAIAGEEAKENELFDFEIVDSSTIQTFVTGENPRADFCILPLNVASNVLGTGSTYQMLGTVTNGNLFFLTTGSNEVLTAENVKTVLLGKTVGVVQLPNVPGLTLRVVLDQYGIDYQIVESVDAEKATDKANLVAYTPDNVTPAGGCDYYLCPEPAASAKIKGPASTGNPFKLAGDLQALYGGEEGYPQAVAVAKKSVLESNKSAVDAFLAYLENAETYLKTADVPTILELLDGKRMVGVEPSFSEKNLTAGVVANCSVRFTASKNCKDKVNAFLDKLISVSDKSAKKVEDAFFYMG